MKEKETLEVGKTYWCYYFDISKRGNSLLNYYRPSKVTVLKRTTSISSVFDFKYDNFDELSDHQKRRIDYNLNYLGFRFLNTEEKCKQTHDEDIIFWAKN